MMSRRFVLDTNVLVSAALFGNSKPAQALNTVLDSGVVLFSLETLEELSSVLDRKKFNKYITLEDKQEFLLELISRSFFVKIIEKVVACRDPKDNSILEVAVNGNANFIITGDDDLLVLNPFKNIVILTPDDWLKIQ